LYSEHSLLDFLLLPTSLYLLSGLRLAADCWQAERLHCSWPR